MTQDIYSLVMAHAKEVIIFLIVYAVLMTSFVWILFVMLDAPQGYEDETGFHTLEDDIKELEARLSSLRNDYGILTRDYQSLKLRNKAILREHSNAIEENAKLKAKKLLEVTK